MPLLLAQVLNAEALGDVLVQGRPVEDIVEGLFNKGSELAGSLSVRSYAGWEEFKRAHAQGTTELVQLEGESNLVDSDVVVLVRCPMAEEMKKFNVDGQSPAFHKEIVEKYKEQNPGSNAILHPGCIAHQVARQIAVMQMSVQGSGAINYYQLACRSGATGKVVFDDNGLEAVGMTKEQAQALVENQACLYVLVRNRQEER